MTTSDDADAPAAAAEKAAVAAEEQAEAARRRAEDLSAAAAAARAQTNADASVSAENPVPAPEQSEIVGIVRAGYAFEGAAIEVGALVDGRPVPDAPVRIPLAMLNRHGLVAGATGTGKTKTLQVLAEQIAAQGPGLRRRHQGRPLRHRHPRHA